MLRESEIVQVSCDMQVFSFLTDICQPTSARWFPEVPLQPKKLAPAPHYAVCSLTPHLLFPCLLLETCEYLIKIVSLDYFECQSNEVIARSHF